MKYRIECVWEHNGDDTLLYAANLHGVYSRGVSLAQAMSKMFGKDIIPDLFCFGDV